MVDHQRRNFGLKNQNKPAGPPSEIRETERGFALETEKDENIDNENKPVKILPKNSVLYIQSRKNDLERRKKRTKYLYS